MQTFSLIREVGSLGNFLVTGQERFARSFVRENVENERNNLSFFRLQKMLAKASSLIESCGTSCSCRYNGQSMTGHAYKKESETYWAHILFSYNMTLRSMFHYEKRDWAQGFLFFFITCGASIISIINL